MEFKRSAGVFVAGISLFLGGPLLSYVGIIFMAVSASRNDSGLLAVFVGVSILGAVAGLVGFFMLLVATHRALAKIDALPLRIQSAQRQSWAGDRG
ncbi:hypothetical protein [Arthrobacter humicola]